MKDFQKFLEEITIKGSPGVPGEGDKQPGDKDYLSDIERRAKQRLGITGREHPSQFGPRIMDLVGQSQRFTRGNEDDLEELAKDIILNNFGDILEGVNLDIKLVRSGQEVANFMEEQSDDQPEIPNFRRVTDPEIMRRIHKAKLGNVIIQGEAKNTKHILHTEEVKDGIRTIFGDRADSIFNIWDEISKLADKMDWIIPIEVKADMMERAPQGMAGAVSVKWEPKQQEEEEEGSEEDEYKEEEGPEEDEYKEEEETGEDFESFIPTIRARGIDFPMLIHETVKGIFELIAAVSQPGMDADEKEIEISQTVKLNVSSFEDEAEDFRTGPEIAADFRDFINENPKSDVYPNMRAYIFGMMMDPNYMTSKDFLTLFRGILNGTPEARRKVDNMIDEVADKLKSYELGEVLPDEVYDSDDVIDDNEKKDLSTLSQRQIQDLIDVALDESDFEEVKRLSQFLKEGREIYLKEIDRINEKYNSHTRRK
jgi:hypothetical protein